MTLTENTAAPATEPTLIVITGATGSGKSDLAVRVARHLGCDIVNADSRQIYKGIPIGTAAPTPDQLNTVRHHFVQTLDLHEGYSAAMYEEDVLRLLPKLFKNNRYAVMCGGSMMYIDAVCRGIDALPTISDKVRQNVLHMYRTEGLEGIRRRLLELDPDSHNKVAPLNPRRNIHALEICLEAGVPCSSLLTGNAKPRDFRILKFYIDLPREVLFDRINRRVDSMIEAGLEDEARSVYHLRHLNALNTVGYKEMFAMFDGTMDRDTAIARMAKNTRVYAKKQLTWLRRASSQPAAIPLIGDDFLAEILLHL